MTRHRSRLVATLAAVLLLVSACGDDDDTETADTTASSESTTTSSESSTTSSEPTTTESGDPESLPGEVIDLFPYEGAEMAVVGVEADDVLNVRSGPAVDFDVVTTLDPLSDGEAIATGTNRQLDSGAIWAELEIGDVTGWANTAFLLQSGVVDDVTTTLYPAPADRPTAETLDDLAQTVGGEVASDQPPSDITIVDGPTVGDLGEVTVDVIGLGDDAVGGLRLHVFAEEGPDGFTVRTIEQTTMCSRGVTDDGLCV